MILASASSTHAVPQDLFANLPIATILVDAGCVTAINPAAEDLLGVGSTSVRGVPAACAIPAIAAIVARLDEGATTADITEHGVALTTTGGRDAIVSLVATRLEGRTGIIAMLPTISRAAPADSAGLVASGAAVILGHEIKNPLSGIRGAAQVIESRAPGVATQFTQLICDEVDRIAGLIDRMQDFSRPDARPVTAQSIYPPIRRAIEVARAGFARDILVTERFDPSLPDAMIDADSLVQVILNLLRNAADALGDISAPAVTITAAYRSGLRSVASGDDAPRPLPIEISVEDNGPGIAEAVRSEIFQPFVSGRRSGIGLGLALVDRLIRDMGGTIEVDPRTASGASFCIRLATAL